MAGRIFVVYIMSSVRRTIYVGVTGNLEARVMRHKSGLFPGFTSKYNCKRLVYFEQYDEPYAAIAREKQIKRWTRAKKIALIERMNPSWDDLMGYVELPEGLAQEDFDRWI